MPPDPAIDAYVRGRFVSLPGAQLRPLTANAVTIRLPKTPEVAKALRVSTVSIDALDPEIVLAIDGEECTQALVSSEDAAFVDVTALL